MHTLQITVDTLKYGSYRCLCQNVTCLILSIYPPARKRLFYKGFSLVKVACVLHLEDPVLVFPGAV